MPGIERVTEAGKGNLFHVIHYGGIEYTTTAEAAARKIIDEIEPLLDDVSAGLQFLAGSLERAANEERGGLRQWQVMGILGLIRGIQGRAAGVELDLRAAIDVLRAFGKSERHKESHGQSHAVL